LSAGLAAAVAQLSRIRVSGTFLRHTAIKHPTISGHPVGGRWAPPDAFPILYLGRPEQSVVVEAHRHLVEATEGMRPELVGPRLLLTCAVDVDDVIDLRSPEDWANVGLDLPALRSEVGDYAPCQRLGAKAHQLGRTGVLAPSASGLGETLALFTNRLSSSELPVLTERVLWETLPHDPRRLRLVNEADQSS
jgi:hypothetical protein